jgi:uncharacterized membrane protein YfhO
MIKKVSPTLKFITLLLGVNILLYRDFIFRGEVPIAFDYGVYNYQPWKVDHNQKFSEKPKSIGHDDIKIFYPQRKFISNSLSNWKIPFWNPFEFAGNVAASNSQTAIFYPPFALFLIFSQVAAWSLLSFSTPIIAGLGTFLFLRYLVESKYAAIFGALIFAYSSSIITRSEDGLVAGHSLIWLPWVVYGIEKYLKQEKILGLVLSTLALSFSMLAGWFQFTFYVYILAISYALYKWFVSEKENQSQKKLLLTLIIFPLSILFTAFHWMPAIEAFSFSPRGVLGTPQEFITQHLMPISHLLTLIVPNFFGHIASNTYYGISEFKEGVLAIGIIPFIISLLVLLKKTKKPPIKFFLSLAIISMVLGINNPIAKGLMALKIPLISTFLPNRIFSLTVFSLSILAAFGFQELKGKIFEKLKIITLVITGIFLSAYLTVAGIYVYEKTLARSIGLSLFEKGIERYIVISVKESLLPFTLLLLVLVSFFIKKEKRNKAILVVIFITTLISQLYRGNRNLYFSKRENAFPASPIFSFLQENTQADKSRFISLSHSRIPANVPTYYQLYFPEGIDAMYPIWYGEFARFYEGKEVATDDLLRIETTYSEELERRKWLDPKTINLISHLGIRYVLVPSESFHILPPEPAFKKAYSYKLSTIYEYNYAFPKAYFVKNHKFIRDKDIALQRIFYPTFFDELEVVLSERKNSNLMDASNIDLVKKYDQSAEIMLQDPFMFAKKAQASFSENPVKVTEFKMNQLSLEAEVKNDGFVVINESYFPGWSAEVDGLKTEVYRANHAFIALPIKKGQHSIVLSFEPSTFKTGLATAFATIAFIIIVMIVKGIKFLWKK